MLENCRWLLYISRFFGCHPHTIDEISVFTNFRPLAIYSVVACGVYCAAAYYAFGFATLCATINVGCVLQQINRYTRTLYMILSTLLSYLRHTEFERTIAKTRKFDDLMQYRRWCTDNKRQNYYIQWLIILLIFGAWVLFAAVAMLIIKKISATSEITYYTFVIQYITRMTFSMEIAKFCFLYDALRRRFRLLNKLCHGLIGITVGVDIDIFRVSDDHNLTIMNLQQLHRYLSDATNHLTSYYNPQLLCWIACMLIDITTFVFANLYGNTQYNNVLLVCSRCMMIVYLSFQVIAISRICHLTCNQANALAGTVFSTEASTCKPNEFLTVSKI
ncbi:uncharacterized protein [Temnothorax nylanderi]|uniref:uncharacterized protein n=1 Tax=Temnothorax nylanderi TaxID=102681 RepID=UPI003A851A95